ncbi:hypothetical protein BRC93_14830 [Halobacteriales archaeon QS_5_70_15]|nr:MAG: hypothetical protein BRC93_14830 [Halobacteriales archaeon QS_5_70_15]
MPIDIGDVVRRGYERTVARNGLLFAAILFVVSVLDAMFSPGSERGPMPPGGAEMPGMPPSRRSLRARHRSRSGCRRPSRGSCRCCSVSSRWSSPSARYGPS